MSKIAVLFIIVLCVFTPAQAQEPAVRGWISIPSIWTYAKPIVDDNWDLSDLGQGVAHLNTTNWIDDDWGRVVIAAHNPGAFSDIGNMTDGDLIALWDTDGYKVYIVYAIHKGVDPSEVRWLSATPEPTLVLLACWDNERTRIVIEATRVE